MRERDFVDLVSGEFRAVELESGVRGEIEVFGFSESGDEVGGSEFAGLED